MARFLISGRRRYGLALILSTVAALFVLAAPAALADSVASDLPFRLNGSGTFTVDFTGTARGTQIGNAAISANVLSQTFPIPPCGSGTNVVVVSETLTAANGDTINETISGGNCQSGPTTFHFTGTYSIVGGTGRFANATGSGSVVNDADLSSSPFTFTQSESGTISLNL